MRPHRPALWWCIPALIGWLTAGCSEELGPVPLKTTRVSGVVSVGGKRLRGGWVEFIPTQGTVGNLCSAPLGPDGTFVARRVAVGRNAIGFVGTPLDPAASAAFHPFATPITRAIPGGASTSLELDLVEEGYRYQKARKSQPSASAGAEPSP